MVHDSETSRHGAREPSPAVLVAEGISKKLGGQEVLRNVSASVERHEVIAIVGPSGAGKSTFLRCLNLLERPDDGHVYLSGTELTSAHKKELPRLRAGIGMVFQSFNLFGHLTAAENVSLAPVKVLGLGRREARSRAEEMLNRVGLAAKYESRPRELSGGQQQRVAIARALAMDPDVMLFDEPTSALDAETVHEVLGVMKDLSDAGMTMVLVSHEVGFVREAAHRVLFMDEGAIVEEAPPSKFFEAPEHPRAAAFVSKIL